MVFLDAMGRPRDRDRWNGINGGAGGTMGFYGRGQILYQLIMYGVTIASAWQGLGSTPEKIICGNMPSFGL